MVLNEADDVVDPEKSKQERQARLKHAAKKREAESAVVSKTATARRGLRC